MARRFINESMRHTRIEGVTVDHAPVPGTTDTGVALCEQGEGIVLEEPVWIVRFGAPPDLVTCPKCIEWMHA